MTRSCSAAGCLALVLFSASPALAQTRTIDEGTFSVTRAGARAQTENFRIVRDDNGAIKATGQLLAGTQQVTSTLTTDSVGTPMSYEVFVKDKGAQVIHLSATAHAGRLTVVALNARGDQSMREYPLTPGNCLILEDGLLHQLYLATLGGRTGTVQVIEPRSARSATVTISAHGMEPIDVAGRSVTGTHYSLVDGSVRRDFWVDAGGRLLRIQIPSQNLTATREELPR